MTVVNELSRSVIIPGAERVFKNYSGSDIAAGTGVLYDTVNKGDPNNPPGIVVPTAAGGVVKTCGVTLETIKASGMGRVVVLGSAIGTANATLNPGDLVEISDVTAHLGQIIASTSTHEILGKAMSAAVAGDPIEIMVNPTAHN